MKVYGFPNFCTSKNHHTIGFSQNNRHKCTKTAIVLNKQSKKSPACLPACSPTHPPACLPAVRLSCARCTGPEILHHTGNCSGFTKLLFQLRLVHCAMVTPLSFISLCCSSLSFKRGEKFAKSVNINNPLWLWLFFLLCHVKYWLVHVI